MEDFFIVYLLTGSNLGDRIENLCLAKQGIHQKAGIVISESFYYKTAAWGKENQPDFFNQALKIKTHLSPIALLDVLLKIEKGLGRERLEKWGSRTIDIDILLYENKIIDQPKLSIPHKHMHERNFALIPLMEIAGEIEHPVFKKTIEELYCESKDTLEVYLEQSL